MNPVIHLPSAHPIAPGSGVPHRALLWGGTYILLGAAMLLLVYFTGPFLQFPILFVFPVALAAWYCGPRTSYVLALILPLGRFAVAVWVDHPSPLVYIIINALVRIVILVFFEHLILRTAQQNRALKQKVESLVKICKWTPSPEPVQTPATWNSGISTNAPVQDQTEKPALKREVIYRNPKQLHRYGIVGAGSEGSRRSAFL